MPKISIVSPYYNRKFELLNTLRTMEQSTFKDFEYIIVDDASDTDHRLEDLVCYFPFIKLVRIDKENKTHVNPCIPYNMGIAMAVGDIIILQSPECMYVGDVLQFVADNNKDNQYLVFSCYSLSKQSTKNLINIDFTLTTSYDSVSEIIGGFTKNSCESSAGRYSSWFAHPIYRPCMFNFLTSMAMEDMRSLGGFDERFFDGHSYDDTEFAERVIKKKMNTVMVESPFCLHQYHPSVLSDIPNFSSRLAKNKALYEQSLKLTDYYVKNSFYVGDTI